MTSVTFIGDVEAIRPSMNSVDVTEVNGYIEVVEGDTKTEYVYTAEGLTDCFFSHDDRPFLDQDFIGNILTSVKRQEVVKNISDGTVVSEGELEDVDLSKVVSIVIDGTECVSAADAYTKLAAGLYVASPFSVKIEDDVLTEPEIVEVTGGNIYIGLKGDANLNGVVETADAAAVLVWIAQNGAGVENPSLQENADLENLAYFLANVGGESKDHGATMAGSDVESPLYTNDASNILVYIARQGAGETVDWVPTIYEPGETPAISQAIYAWDQAHNAG